MCVRHRPAFGIQHRISGTATGLVTYDCPVPGLNGEAVLGLRELKKMRTRATIVDAAARLCAQQGYENTTVDQIAAAADISPRTFSRYFRNKEVVIEALIEDIAQRVAETLVRQSREITEHEALLRAHLDVFRAAAPNELGSKRFDRIGGFLQIVNASPLLGLAAFTYRPDSATWPVIEALASRMDIAIDDPAVRILFDTWAVLMATALGTPGVEIGSPGDIADRIEATYTVFIRLWRPWRSQHQPPAGGP